MADGVGEALELGVLPLQGGPALLELGDQPLARRFGSFALVDLVLQEPGTLGEAAHPGSVAQGRDRSHGQHRQRPEPPGGPEWRLDHHLEAGTLFVPHPAVVAGPDPEGVGAGIEMGVGRAAPALRLDPLFVEAHQHVGVTVLGRRRKAESGELEGENGLIVVEGDPVGLRDVDRQRSVGTDRHRPVEDLERSDDHRRDRPVGLDLGRIELVHAVGATENDLAARRPDRGTVELAALDAVSLVEGKKSPSLRIEVGDSPVGADPEVAGFIYRDGVDDVARQAVRRSIGGDKDAARKVEESQAGAEGSEPEVIAVLFERSDLVHVQAGVACGFARVGAEGVALPLVQRQAPVGAKPQAAAVVPQGRPDDLVRDRGWIPRFGGIGDDFAAIRVEPKGAVEGAKPQVAVDVFGERLDVQASRARSGFGCGKSTLEAAAGAVEQVETSGPGPDPHPAARVLADRQDRGRAEALRVRGLVTEAEERAGRWIESSQTVFGAHPEVPA